MSRCFEDTVVGTLLCSIENIYGRVLILADSKLKGSSTGSLIYELKENFTRDHFISNGFTLGGTMR